MRTASLNRQENQIAVYLFLQSSDNYTNKRYKGNFPGLME